MTRVRKINVSQVEGNDANSTDNGAIRPYGEMAVYENSDGNGPNKLELLIADGVRNNLRSKVLSKGTFYGGDADSGDGNNRDTIKLIPDAVLHRAGGDYDNDQYLIIDPTVGDPVGHIHIRAGGAIDNSTADLFLGGEKNNVRVSDTNNRVTITTETTNDIHNWQFDTDGNLTLPIGGDILDSTGNSVLGSNGDQNIWVQTFESETGAPADVVAVAASVEYDVDGNIIALFNHIQGGGTGGTYYSVGKFTSAGVKLWTARFADDFFTDGWGLAVNGGDGDQIYVAGSTEAETDSYGKSTLTRLNAVDGTVVWSKIYDFGVESTSSVVDVAADGNPVMVGYAGQSTDAYVITTKIDSDTGAVIWSRSLDGQGNENAYGMAVGPEGEIVVIGTMDQLGIIDAAATLYTDPVSNPNWTVDTTITMGQDFECDVSFVDGVPTFSNIIDRVGNRTVDGVITTISGTSFGGTSPADDMILKVATLATYNTSDHMLVVRYLADGTIDWQKAVEFDQEYDCGGADADIDSEGNIYVTGDYTRDLNPGTTSALSIVKFDSAGAKLWSRRVVGDCDTFGSSIVVGPDNKLYLSGVTLPEENGNYVWVVAKYGIDGTVEWQRLIENTTSWSFVGGNFFGAGGGSNLAVKQGYVVLGGGFGNLMDMEYPRATLVQVSSAGNVFAVGDWDFKAASFSGTLNNTASDINMYPANKTSSDNANGIDTGTVTLNTEVSGFLIGTVYRAGGSDERLVNGNNQLVLETTGVVTLPSGGTISEGIVTSNPTIQLTPASPDVASQKLVIKGGGGQYYITENGIDLGADNNVWAVSDSATFYVYAPTRPNETLYWWIVPEESGISTTMSGTVELGSEGGGIFNFTVISDAYEFRVRVSPEQDNYDPATVGVQSVLMNPDAPTLGDYHLHLTTGDLTETSIILGTDDHNVRTTTDGKIQITTYRNSYSVNNVWEFDAVGGLTLPGSSSGRIVEDEPGVVVYSDIGFAVVASANTTSADYTVQFTGFIDDGTNSGNGGSTLHITDIAAGAITDGMTVYGAGLPPEGWVLSFSSSVEPIGSGGTGTYVLAGANYLIASQSFNNGVAADIGPKSWIFDSDGDLRFPDNTVQTTAYIPGNTTVAKQASGIPQSFGLSTSNPSNFTPGSYPNILVGFSGKNVTIDIEIDEFYNISTANIRNASPATFLINDSAVLGGDLFGGATPADDITITVFELVPTAIDLTKTINKLTDGDYSLADGVEGQIMYLVAQNNTVLGDVQVSVANSRISGSVQGGNLLPFRIYENSGEGFYEGTGICTLIFTDGAWQQSGGAWD